MDRQESHFEDDPSLRRDFCVQESFDEFHQRLKGDTQAAERFKVSKGDKDWDMTATTDDYFTEWQSTLAPETSMNEALYLQGFTEKSTREIKLQEIQRKLREKAQRAGLIGRTGRL